MTVQEQRETIDALVAEDAPPLPRVPTLTLQARPISTLFLIESTKCAVQLSRCSAPSHSSEYRADARCGATGAGAGVRERAAVQPHGHAVLRHQEEAQRQAPDGGANQNYHARCAYNSQTAREMVRESLPIKCLEAVVLLLHLTATCTDMQRFAISFKSSYDGSRVRVLMPLPRSRVQYQHIVLGVWCDGLFGALGLSRRDTLTDKPLQVQHIANNISILWRCACDMGNMSHWGVAEWLQFETLAALIGEFERAYQAVQHRIVCIRISRPVPHDQLSLEVPSHPIPSHPIPSHPIPSHPADRCVAAAGCAARSRVCRCRALGPRALHPGPPQQVLPRS